MGKLRRGVVAALGPAAGLAAGLAVLAAGPAQLATAAVQGRDSVSAASFKLPYTDTGQVGQLTFCDKALKPVTHGSITAKPFVWRVVSSFPAPAGYWIKGATAQLFAFQPRQYTPAGAWSGVIMTAASVYSNPKHPVVQLTPIDQPLDYMTESFPPIWDHLVELRMYLGAPDHSEYNRTYAAADLQIKGNTWRLVEGGGGSCTSGTAVSREVLLGLPGASGTKTPAPAAAKGTKGHGTGSAASAGSPATARGTTGSSSTRANAVPVADSHSGAGSSSGPGVPGVLALIALAVLIVASAGWLWRRRRRAIG